MILLNLGKYILGKKENNINEKRLKMPDYKEKDFLLDRLKEIIKEIEELKTQVQNMVAYLETE